MTSTLRSRPKPSTNGSSPPTRFDLEPPSQGSARNKWSEITVGLLVVGLFALVGTWFYSSTSDREPVVTVRNAIERGQQVTAADLMVVDVASDQAINALPGEQSGQILGRTALVDLAPGTLVSDQLFADQALIETGDGVVGLALDPGEYPTLTLRAGDRVRVVETPSGSAADGGSEVVLVADAEVIDVTPIGVQNQLFISVSMATTEADAVVAAASQDRVRLVQVAES